MEKYPKANLKTYVVWFKMLPSDARDKWNPKLISDSRAKHFWDADRSVGKWVSQNVKTCEHLGPIAWDSYYLLDSDASWDDTLGSIESCGTPVFRGADKLTEALEALLKE